MRMTPSAYDLVVVGAGSGGLTAAEFPADLGARVALIERARIGGDCTWTGCVPSKSLIRAARAAEEVRTAGRFGIRTELSLAVAERLTIGRLGRIVHAYPTYSSALQQASSGGALATWSTGWRARVLRRLMGYARNGAGPARPERRRD